MRICRWRLQVVSHKVKGWILFSFSPADLEQKNIKKSNRKCIWQKTKRKHEWILKIKIEQKVLKRQHIMFNAIYLRSNANTLVSICVCVCVRVYIYAQIHAIFVLCVVFFCVHFFHHWFISSNSCQKLPLSWTTIIHKDDEGLTLLYSNAVHSFNLSSLASKFFIR